MSIYAKSGLGVRAPEATQFIQAQAGCSGSLNQLMARHDGLVQAVVRQQVLGELPFEEALQAGRIGLWRAILGFDPERGFAFSTYAWPCIKHRIWRAVKAYGSNSEYDPMASEEGCSESHSGGERVWNSAPEENLERRTLMHGL